MIKGYRVRGENLLHKNWCYSGMNYHLNDKCGQAYWCGCSRGIRGMFIMSLAKGRKAYKLKRGYWIPKLGRVYK